MNLEILKKICIDNKIPILRDDSINKICEIININCFSNMLEIGSGFGYSSLYFFLNSKIKNIISLEKNIDNFFYLSLISQTYKNITFINVDAFEYNTENKFDLILIDGPKSKQNLLFEKYEKFLKENGIIIIDNIFMNNLRKLNTIRANKLIGKVDDFKNYLKSLNDWNIDFLDIGDGLAICKRK